MTEVDYIAEVHRRERRQMEFIVDCAVVLAVVVGYGVAKLVWWLL